MKRRSVWFAVVLWFLFAFAVWNVIFDRVLVLAGRRYVHDAAESARHAQTYLLIDDRMRPAIAYGVAAASIAAVAILAIGLAAIASAARRERSGRGALEETPETRTPGQR